MTFEVGRLSAALTLDGLPETLRGLDQTKSMLSETTAKAAETGKAADGLSAAIRRAATQNASELNLMGSAFTKVGVAAAAASGLAIAKWANFDQAMSNVYAATHESASAMHALEQAALDAGARTVFSATEAANAIEELAKAGVSTKDILSGGLDGALDLAAAGGLAVADAAGIAAVALRTFNLEGDQMGHVSDLLAAGAGKAMGDVSDLSAALNQSAMVANATGLSIEETTAGLAAFASQGLLGSDAGTSFKSMLQSLTPSSAAAQKAMDELGISAYDQQGNFIGLAEFAGRLQDGLSGLSTEQQQAALKTIFGSDAIRAATVLYSEGEAGIREWTEAVNDQGYAAETAAARLDNLKGDLEALGGALDTALIQTGSGANEMLRSMVQILTEAVDAYNALPAPVQSATLGFGLLVAGVGLLGGALMRGVVQVAEFKAATAALGISGADARSKLGRLGAFLGGPWGVALAVAGTAMHLFNQEIEKGVPTAEELQNALRTTASAADQMAAATSRGGLETTFFGNYATDLKRLPELLEDAQSSWRDMSLTIGERGTLDSIKRYGDALGELAAEDAPAASEAFRDMAAEYDVTGKGLSYLLDEMPGFKAALTEQATAMGMNASESNLLKLAMGELGPSLDAGAEGASGQAEALTQLVEKAEASEEAVSSLAEEIAGFGSTTFDMREANRQLEESLDKLAEGLAENGANFEIGEEVGRGMQSMLDDVARSANEAAANVLTETQSQEQMNEKLAEGRERLIDILEPYMGSRNAAAEYVEQLNLISPEKVTEIVADTQQAVSDVEAYQAVLGETPNEKWTKLFVDRGNSGAELQAHLDALRNIPGYKETVINTVMKQTGAPRGQVGAAYNAMGGIWGPGGRQFVSGGFASGMYNGVVGGVHKLGVDGTPHMFAEKHLGVPWETYISGHPAYRERNIGLALDTLRRLAFPVVPASALGGVPGFAAGGTVGTGSSSRSAAAPRASVRPNISFATTVHAAPGQSEEEIARIAESRIAFKLGGLM